MLNLRTAVPALALSILVLAGVVACATGTPEAAAPPPATSDREQGLKFAQCMRDHGVDMPDPGTEGVVTGPGSGALPSPGASAPTLTTGDDSAFEACRKFLPNGGEVRKPTAAEREQMVRYAACMREQGIDYPDPGPDGAAPVAGVPVGDTAAMQRMEAAARACEAQAGSTAPAK
ncbi:hypothetical protein GCM10022251_74850 [Phytohabitans flavus]|uniref:Secreted protein n=1 Tax=Phytohabitans flavus TaxID=1076124 RepID=A0A6F8XLH4_9ACTN|nr:hypothetical protein [Phytohabitans flavus]BCB74657.1 hypothetical protein Pflav_010670 [Phytohabitans flavus]